jgi:integrase
VPTAHHAYLNADEARRVLLAALPGEDRLRWVCALMLGLRQGEALGLDWSMVSLDDGAGYVRVERALQRQTGKGLVMTDLKSQSSHRVVPLIPLVAAVFQDQLERSGGVGLVFGGGKPKDPRKDWGEWREALTRADAPLVPLHGARASCATLLRSQGVPERVIADILGHREVATTQAHYIRSDDAQRRAALAVLGPLLPIGQ